MPKNDNEQLVVKPSKWKNFKDTYFLVGSIDIPFLGLTIALLTIGLIMLFSASYPYAYYYKDSSYYYFIRQLIFAVGGLVGMFFFSKINYNVYKKMYKMAYVVSVLILLLVLIPNVGVEANGATRWIKIPIIGQFQPSELTKIGLIIFYAGYLTEHKDELRDFWRGFVKPLCFILPPIAVLYLVQNHLSASLIIGMITCIMMLIAGTRLVHFIIVGAIGGGGLISYLIYKVSSGGGDDSFRIGRIISFLDPWQDLTGTGWQVVQSLYAIGSGGLFGAGLGESKQKYLYISEPQNDFIFAIVAEELGFIGCLIIMILFGILIWRGVLIAIKAPDTFSSLLATGIVSLVAIQVILNIAVVTSSIPNTGIPLPFFSYGGTALLILLCSMRYFTKHFTSGLKSIKGELECE